MNKQKSFFQNVATYSFPAMLSFLLLLLAIPTPASAATCNPVSTKDVRKGRTGETAVALAAEAAAALKKNDEPGCAFLCYNGILSTGSDEEAIENGEVIRPYSAGFWGSRNCFWKKSDRDAELKASKKNESVELDEGDSRDSMVSALQEKFEALTLGMDEYQKQSILDLMQEGHEFGLDNDTEAAAANIEPSDSNIVEGQETDLIEQLYEEPQPEIFADEFGVEETGMYELPGTF